MDTHDLLTIGEVAERSGFATSALRYYEQAGLIQSTRTSGQQRRYERSVLRRLAFIRAARNIGLGLEEVRSALDDCRRAARPTAPTGPRCRGPGGSGSTSRSRRWSSCATGWIPASAAAACRCSAAG